ncbi:SusD/RagB family nutrient-binding outer membrane lipoprotein [Pedobacter sp. N36a]|uniref:SusD/RagB family nutrient-binding outer membrane lipoprotein n=1 Tax=Pedobacter sp. N36a TaxID=2767996 RepID=UPI001656A5D8|nr:SusD/RagB family nutrient-binding outer membrane lipoprotein [Pedobacter sp. N36a]MBC8984372.1 SusD/RagB family nutrient-binding outer membrane lipoprotein [Pedobacter sp. N36a]
MKTLFKKTGLGALVALSLVMAQSSCTKDYDVYNSNPNGLTDADLQKDNTSAGIFLPEMQVNVAYYKTNDDYIYQLQQNLNADIFSGYFAPTGDFGGPNNASYALKTGWNLCPFKVGYSGIMNSWREERKRAAANPQYIAVADILKVEGMYRVTDVYGPIPYTKFGTGVLYAEGVKLSCEQVNASGVDIYLANNTGTQAPYTDPINAANNVPANSPLLSKTTVKWDEAASTEQKLERIITQKWIAIFPDGMEAWSEFRRTGYPKIFPVVNNQSGGTIDTDKQIRRLPFSDDEYKNNTEEVTKAISLLGGGPDNGGTKLWWDKKN